MLYVVVMVFVCLWFVGLGLGVLVKKRSGVAFMLYFFLGLAILTGFIWLSFAFIWLPSTWWTTALCVISSIIMVVAYAFGYISILFDEEEFDPSNRYTDYYNYSA